MPSNPAISIGERTAADSKQQQLEQLAAAWHGRTLPTGLVIPRISTPVFAVGYNAAALAYGTQIQLATYTAKAGYYLVIAGIVVQFTGGGPVPNPGDLLTVVDINRPLGAPNSVGYTEKDYGSVPFLLGSFQTFPWPCEFRFENGEQIRLKTTPVANMGVGAGNFLYGALIGFEWPKRGEDI